jgi:hypothetical protein
MYNVRHLTEEDYEVLVTWWQKWNWTAPPRDFLPENGRGGLMIEKNGIPIVAGFIYFTNSKVAWTEFVISNFDYKEKKDRKEAIMILISELIRIAREKGSKYIYTVVKNKSLVNHYLASGYTVGSRKVDEMFIIIE